MSERTAKAQRRAIRDAGGDPNDKATYNYSDRDDICRAPASLIALRCALAVRSDMWWPLSLVAGKCDCSFDGRLGHVARYDGVVEGFVSVLLVELG